MLLPLACRPNYANCLSNSLQLPFQLSLQSSTASNCPNYFQLTQLPSTVTTVGVLEDKVDRSCRVDLPGGPLFIEWRESDGKIYMTGPAERAFSGVVHV